MSIRKKILLILLVFAFIPMIFVGVLGFVNARKSLMGARMEALKSVADFKAKMIEDFFSEQKNTSSRQISTHSPQRLHLFGSITGGMITSFIDLVFSTQ